MVGSFQQVCNIKCFVIDLPLLRKKLVVLFPVGTICAFNQ